MDIPLEDEFPQQDGLAYLNHAAVGPWPKRTADAVKQFADENVLWGATRYPVWATQQQALRGQLQRLINAPSHDDIAFLKNTSEALSIVAYGLNWRTGDNVVISDQEFPSNRIVWESLQDQGVSVKVAALDAAPSPEESLIRAIDPRTRLLSISSVQYASGLRLDLSILGEHCRKHHVLFCVDAIQSIGAVEFDVQRINADFAMADGHKWMLAPEGLALFYCAPERRDELKLSQYGWHMVQHYGDYDRTTWEIAQTARRFECGSPNMLGIHAMSASVSLFEEIGMRDIERCVLDNTNYLVDALSDVDDIDMITPRTPSRRAGIVTFKTKQTEVSGLFSHLRKHNVICALRGGGIRFSPHFYTPRSVLDHAVDLVANYKKA